jgi:hypothetical protein
MQTLVLVIVIIIGIIAFVVFALPAIISALAVSTTTGLVSGLTGGAASVVSGAAGMLSGVANFFGGIFGMKSNLVVDPPGYPKGTYRRSQGVSGKEILQPVSPQKGVDYPGLGVYSGTTTTGESVYTVGPAPTQSALQAQFTIAEATGSLTDMARASQQMNYYYGTTPIRRGRR